MLRSLNKLKRKVKKEKVMMKCFLFLTVESRNVYVQGNMMGVKTLMLK